MSQYKDKSNIFEDFNFKLIVIDSLLSLKPKFENQLGELKEKYVENYEWYSGKGIINEMVEFFENLNISQDDLDKVGDLCFDGGNEVYFLLQPDWDGEDDIFDIASVKGFEHLKNLKKVEYISMCCPKVLEPFIEQGIEVE